MIEKDPNVKYTASVEGTSVTVGPSDKPRYFDQGAETMSASADIAIHEDGHIKAEIKDGFVLLVPAPELAHIKPNFAQERFEKLAALKRINMEQAKSGGHQFTLPNTFRIVKLQDGTEALLETDITEGGKMVMVDLKKFQGYQFDQQTKDFIVDTIRKDMNLAAKHRITLTHWQNTYAPLDTWHLVINPETGEKKLYILDVGFSVDLNQSQNELDQGIEKTEFYLKKFNVGPDTRPVGSVVEDEIDEEKLSL